MTINQINLETNEGKLLLAALCILTTSATVNINGKNVLGTRMEPDQMLFHVETLSQKMDLKINKDLPPLGPGPGNDKQELIERFLTFISRQTAGILFGSGHNPGNLKETVSDFLNIETKLLFSEYENICKGQTQAKAGEA